MEYQDLSTFAVVGLGLLAAFNLIWAAYKNLKEAQKPSETLRDTVEAHAEMLDRDNKRLHSLEEGQRLNLRAISQLIEHELTHNHEEQLKQVKDEINHYLINK